ncbi:TolC family protein [Marivirga sp. S37H4]|uniref:TolC family protein n=1 Tax=Marivirga aurantiaca TaxID=2802615 RepID=A0A935CAD2_9BACT|nr:TolC family protein [Marivirga aurantiaca]MBK6266530.1 TolC family protein [Marivirga aurantiaca]
MKLLLFFSLTACSLSFAQNVDYNKVILPDNTRDIEFAEKLVQLAWNNHPSNENVKEDVEIARIDYKLSKRNWIENFRMSGNLNEFNVDPSRDIRNRSQFLPRYNFSVSFALGELFNDPLRNKQYRIRVDMSENAVNSLKLMVRRDVLQAYNTYVMLEEVYKIQRLAMDNAETNHTIIEENFEQGEETYERYNNSFSDLNQKRITILQAERDLKNSKLVLEEMIGIPLEDVN